MAIKYEKKQKQNNVLHTIITSVLICAVFLSMVTFLYNQAEDEAYEMLHIQTKTIKDDLSLQLRSDCENLSTMANFAARLYAHGESYDRVFESFKPIGLFARIGVLKQDNTFIMQNEVLDFDGKLSFAEEMKRGTYVSGRVPSFVYEGREIIRCAAPIVVDGRTVGILYGVIDLADLNMRYSQMAKELSAQLFVYEPGNGNFIIDTFSDVLGNVSSLKTRDYNDDYTYEELVTAEKGYSSFKSIYNGQNLYVHYSTVDEVGWRIMLARYEDQVFANLRTTIAVLTVAFMLISLIILIYTFFLMRAEKQRSLAVHCTSNIRRILLELNQDHESCSIALKNIVDFVGARSAFIDDAEGEEHFYIRPRYAPELLRDETRQKFVSEIFRYATELQKVNRSPFGMLSIRPNAHLKKTNYPFYTFLEERQIWEVAFAYVTDRNNHLSVLGCINPKKSRVARILLEDVAVCFSIALFNKKYLNKTEVAATTDSLTGALNRVSYNNDILVYDEEKPEDFACIFVDVNELNMRNNKYGHAAGDEMLIYIANTLKDVFFGHKIYRMGGDEFLVFTSGISQEQIKKSLETFVMLLSVMDYHVAIGTSYRKQNLSCEELVREAEIRMYEAKSQYYQNKETASLAVDANEYVQIKTGIREIDTMLSIMKEHYNGIYRVSLENDHARRILMPEYLGYNEDENNFSNLLFQYIDEYVHPDFRRAMMSYIQYDAIKRQISEMGYSKITYKKASGESVVLSIYPLGENMENINDTLWVFAKS
ncbi:MAG: GGDEF domain-containing protein [Ruminococcaceae bacterium]|nr:GGDEF domain-containing protein [Oscillospiraceae bacterium]